MVRSFSTSRRAHSRRFAVSALATSIALALGSAHAQTVSATSVPITGRAPVVTIASITNQTVPGQAPAVGHVLHANASVVDPDNDGIVDTIYRWKRGGTEVGTGVDYTATAADEGQTLTLEVEATTDSASTDPDRGSATSTVSVVGNAAPTATPTITFDGTLDVDTVLTGNPGYADTENDPQGVHTYQWYRADDAIRTNQVAISGATNSTYTATSEDRGKFIVLGVVPRATVGPAQGNEGFATTTVAVPVAATAPEAQTPSISGTLKTGNTLSALFSYHDNEFDPPGTHKYQWFRDNGSGPVDIPLATNKDYVLTSADQGDHYIGVRITPVSTIAPTDGLSVEVRTTEKFIGSAPTATPTITFEGAFGIGTVLTGNVGYLDAQDDPQGAHTYQWYRADDAAGTNAVAIGSATAATYTLVAADAGKHVIFEVVPKSGAGTPATGVVAESAKTAMIPNAPAKPEARNRSVSGNLLSGSTLRAEYEFYDINNDAEDTTATGTRYQWYRHKPGSYVQEITGATSREYKLTSADQGEHYIGVYITPYAVNAPVNGNRVETQTAGHFLGIKPTANPTITGTTDVGETLTANPGYNDIENDAQGGTTYQWCAYEADGTTLVACAAPSTSNTWILPAGNLGKRISVRVIPKSSVGYPNSGDEVESPKTAVISQAFINETNYMIPPYGSVDSAVTVSGVPGSASATSVVGVDVRTVVKSHIKLQLIAPDGTTFLLKDFGGELGNGIHQTYTLDLSGETANGQWKLRASNKVDYTDFELERFWFRPR